MTKAQLEKAMRRYQDMALYENDIRSKGAYQAIAGIDEAGRGPLAGPVCAAAVILDPDRPIFGLNDSKKLSEKQREALFPEILDKAISSCIVFRSAQDIDHSNILRACQSAMREALLNLDPKADYVLLDAVHLNELPIPQEALIHGDARANCIAAASILAKVSRDRYMKELDQRYPGYGFAQHKGYGTAQHYAALDQLGPCPEHRLTFLKKLKLGLARPGSGSRALGRHAEERVAEHLTQQGYRILAQNFAIQHFGEVDLIAEKDENVLIIEVKARQKDPDAERAEAAYTAQKDRRIRLLGEYYLDSRHIEAKTIQTVLAAVQFNAEHEVIHIHYLRVDP